MIYLRARWYNPADGRFQSRDTWGGDYNRPLSLNRWNYTKANPVNYVDPTGNNPLVTGYMEGYSEGGGLGQGFIEGKEIVYDYATMTRARFTYTGNVGGILASAGWTLSAGPISGFNYEPDNVQSELIRSDYSGGSSGAYIGAGPKLPTPLGLGFTTGVGFFYSHSSSVKGIFTYFSLGAGIPVDGVWFESQYTVDNPALPESQNGIEYYADANGKVNRGKLVSDILTGNHSPIGHLSGVVLPSVGLERLSQISAVLVAAEFFESYHKQIQLIKCAPRHYGPPRPYPDPLKDFPNPFPLPNPYHK